MEDSKFNARRRLCPDGACIGVVGVDGRCTVCGQVAGAAPSPDAPEALGAPAEGPESEVEAPTGDGNVDAPALEAGEAVASGGFDPRRRLCDDEACIGVVGPAGVCAVCGRKAP